MKTISSLLLVAFFLTNNSIQAEGLYKWTDAKGNTQYGDQPPANSNAKQIDLPKITIIDNYADQWKPIKFDDSTQKKQPEKVKQSSSLDTYTKLDFLAPKPNQGIRANDGDVTAMISIKPPLKKGHKFIYSIDGKATSETKSRTKNFSNLNRGGHTITVKVVDARGKTVKSNSVGFSVLRTSVANLDSDQNSTNQLGKQIKSFNSVRQQQLQNSN